MRGVLRRVLAGDLKSDAPLRTDEVEGVFDFLPALNKKFVIIASPIVDGAYGRLVATSKIVELELCPYVVNPLTGGCRYSFTTESGSKYQLDISILEAIA